MTSIGRGLIGRRAPVRPREVEHSIGAAFDDVLSEAKRGDDTAATVLYDNHVAMVAGYLHARGVANPEDLTADVFVGMLRNITRFAGNHADFKRWLMTIAHRRLVDSRRRHKSSLVDFVDPAELNVPPDRATVDLRAIVVDQRLIDAFQTLTESQQEVLALRFMADLSLEDVAAITDRPVGAVKSLQHRALHAVRHTLGADVAVESGY